MVRAACHVLGAALTLVFVADDTLLWIAGWQGVAVSSFLVMVVSGDRAGRRAGFGYAVITQVGLACLMAALLLLARDAGGLDFAALRAATVHGRPGLFVAFAGLVGFAALAGLAPLHLWLRYLNPVVAAPAAALIGGVAVLAGAFGMVRFSFERRRRRRGSGAWSSSCWAARRCCMACCMRCWSATSCAWWRASRCTASA